MVASIASGSEECPSMRSATSGLLICSVAASFLFIPLVSGAEAKSHAHKSSYSVSARHMRSASRDLTRYDVRDKSAHGRRYESRTPNSSRRFAGPILNFHPRGTLSSGSDSYPPYGYPFTNQAPNYHRPRIGFYNSPYVGYSTSPFTGYYGWYGRLAP